MNRWWLVLPAAILVAQVFQPDRAVQPNDPAHDLIAVTEPTMEVQDLLRNACYDCHSDRTTFTNLTFNSGQRCAAIFS
jgi:hypothetical protein